MRLNDVLKGIVIQNSLGDMTVEVSALSCSSSDTSESAAFFALRGSSKDGHDFIPDAIKSGTPAIVLDRKELLAGLGRFVSEGRPTLVLVENAELAGQHRAIVRDPREIGSGQIRIGLAPGEVWFGGFDVLPETVVGIRAGYGATNVDAVFPYGFLGATALYLRVKYGLVIGDLPITTVMVDQTNIDEFAD